MSLILSSLRCPWCQQPVTKAELRDSGALKAYLAREPVDCPHCGRGISLPEKAETMISSGLFIAVILAPMFYLYGWLGVNPMILFGLGVALVLAGAWFQKLQKVEPKAGDEQEDKPNE